jgi:transcriptional regulator with XRE-family HTH domain
VSESLGPMLRRLRIRAGLSQNALARTAGVDPAYVNRLEAGRTTHDPGARHPAIDRMPSPRRGVVLSLAITLSLSDPETDRFLFAAGLAPAEDWQTRAEFAEARLERILALVDAFRDDRDEAKRVTAKVKAG